MAAFAPMPTARIATTIPVYAGRRARDRQVRRSVRSSCMAPPQNGEGRAQTKGGIPRRRRPGTPPIYVRRKCTLKGPQSPADGESITRYLNLTLLLPQV